MYHNNGSLGISFNKCLFLKKEFVVKQKSFFLYVWQGNLVI